MTYKLKSDFDPRNPSASPVTVTVKDEDSYDQPNGRTFEINIPTSTKDPTSYVGAVMDGIELVFNPQEYGVITDRDNVTSPFNQRV
jgi:hypothetical protein